jgi:glycosyltransferase involved in cell wall biosynthesis
MAPRAWIGGYRGLKAVWLREGRPILHVNGRRGNFLALLLKARFPRLSFVTTVHGVLGLHVRRNLLYRLVDLATGRIANATIAVSADTNRRLMAAGLPQGKVHTITNGLASCDLSGLSDIAYAREPGLARVGFYGRLSPEKGFPDFLQLARRLNGSSGTSFLVAGTGPSLEDFLRQSHEMVADGRLEYLGEADDSTSFLGDVNVLVIPSRNEGLPYVLLEAMAAGCAVVAYAVGGIPEVIGDDSVGILVNPKDLEGLDAEANALVADPARVVSVGRAASQHIGEKFALRDRLPQLLNVYRKCDAARAQKLESVMNAEEGVACES